MSDSRKEVLDQFLRMQTLLHRYQTQSFMSFGPWGNPQRGQGRVLSILKMKPEITQKELTYLLGMSKQSLTELLDKLEKIGFIKREQSGEDRRSFIIKLTKEGAAVADKIDDTSPELEKIFDCLSDEELANLREYLKRIIERLEEQFTGNNDDFRKQMMGRFMGHNGDDFCKQMMERFMRRSGSHFGTPEQAFNNGDFPDCFGGTFFHGWSERKGDDDERI